MATNVGNAFVYGELKAVKPVDCKGVNGKYIRIIKIEEHYNMHEETYTTTDSKGNKKEKTRCAPHLLASRVASPRGAASKRG